MALKNASYVAMVMIHMTAIHGSAFLYQYINKYILYSLITSCIPHKVSDVDDLLDQYATSYIIGPIYSGRIFVPFPIIMTRPHVGTYNLLTSLNFHGS